MANSAERIYQLDTVEPRWFAVYTKYKTEKSVAERLAKKGIISYVPLLKYTKKYTRKIRHVEVPLISCYVFVKITKAEYIKVLETQNVSHFLKINRDLFAIPEKEMKILQWVVGENMVENVHSAGIVRGQEVEVVAGNLTGLRGIVLDKKNKHQFIVTLESLDLSLDVIISKDMLQPIMNLSKVTAR